MKQIILSIIGLGLAATATLFLALGAAAKRGDRMADATESEDGAEQDSKE